jgi:general stress protein 26
MKGNNEKLAKMIKDISFAMLTTVDADGNLHSRPMATMDNMEHFDGTL